MVVVEFDMLEFCIDRHRDDFDQIVYTCRECLQEAHNIPEIQHEDTCPCTTPDDVPLPLATDTFKANFLWSFLDRIDCLMEENEYTTDLIDDLRDVDGVRWVAHGSTSRIVLGLGRTTPRGDFYLDDHRGLVLKLDADIRYNDLTPVGGNIDELLTWETAIQTETTPFFAEILGAARDGMWLLMEAGIPIQLAVSKVTEDRDMIYDESGTQFVKPLLAAARHEGWVDADYKHGNIGLNDNDTPVFLDYGTGPRYEPESIE